MFVKYADGKIEEVYEDKKNAKKKTKKLANKDKKKGKVNEKNMQSM